MECNHRETGWRTDLLCAAASGLVADVQWSLETDVDVDAADVDGRTPLMWAAAEGHADVVRLLLDAKADGRLKDISGFSAIHWAIAGDHAAATRSRPCLTTGTGTGSTLRAAPCSRWIQV
jgi:ankyrin repeat protein